MISMAATRKFAFSLTIFVVIGLILFISVPAYAQVAGATLSGTVTDTSGAVVPNGKVSIKNTATGITRDITSNAAGFYSAPNLLPGPYEVTTSAPGFSTQVRTGITLGVGASQVLNVALQVGQITQKVEVTGAAPAVELATSTIGAQVTGTTVRQLPLNGRDWTQLATLQPGIGLVRTQVGATSTGGRGNRGFGSQLSDAGHSPYENNYRINGISENDFSNGSPGSVLGVQLGVDGIAEFSVQSANYPAEYGRSSGAVINAITRSGTNQFHGDAYWFLRDEGLDARNFFDKNIAPFHRNQFGVSAGGPIEKDKTFIFGDFEGIREDLGLSFFDTVPSAAARAGNLCSAPTTGTCTPTAIAVNPLIQPYLAFWPEPNGGLTPSSDGDVGFFDTAAESRVSENYVSLRGDDHISDKNSIDASYFYDKSSLTQPDALLIGTINDISLRQLASLEWNHIFSSSLVNTARIGFNRPTEGINEPGVAINPLASDTALAAIPGRFSPILSVPGLTTMQGALGNQSPTFQELNSYQAYDDLFLAKGNHSLKFGFAVENIRHNMLSPQRPNGQFTFPSLEGFLLNQPSNALLPDPSIQQELGARQTLFGLYAQDDWRARPNLTLNLGLRYEPATLPTDEHDIFQVVRNWYGGTLVPVKTLWETNSTLHDFAPRLGFAWDPFHNGKTSVRGGFGLYDALPLSWTYAFGAITAYPFNFVAGSGSLPAGSFPTGALALVSFSNIKDAASSFFDPNPKRAYAMNWNFNIQRQIMPNTSLTIGYVGSHSVHLPFKSDDENQVLPTLTSAGYLWPFPVGSGTVLNTNVSELVPVFRDIEQTYGGLLATVSKRMSHSFQVQGSYTYSRCFDTGTISPVTDAFSNTSANLMYFNRAQRFGPCDYDTRHAFVGNYLWELPTPKSRGAFVQKLGGGWQVGGIITLSSGTPFSVSIGGNPLGQNSIAGNTDYPDRLAVSGCANPINSGNPNNYLKLNCFVPPIAPTSFAAVCQPAAASSIANTCMNLFGNSGRNQIYGPGLAEWDFSLIKNTYFPRISENFNLQFRAEFFNILNRANFEPPFDNATLFNQDGTATGGAGIIDSTATTSRQIQFALRLEW